MQPASRLAPRPWTTAHPREQMPSESVFRGVVLGGLGCPLGPPVPGLWPGRLVKVACRVSGPACLEPASALLLHLVTLAGSLPLCPLPPSGYYSVALCLGPSRRGWGKRCPAGLRAQDWGWRAHGSPGKLGVQQSERDWPELSPAPTRSLETGPVCLAWLGRVRVTQDWPLERQSVRKARDGAAWCGGQGQARGDLMLRPLLPGDAGARGELCAVHVV